jgi:hypothetical protein
MRRQDDRKMILTISESARRAGVARSTLYEMKLRGDLSFTRSPTGKQGIDLSELSRMFPHVVSSTPTMTTQDDKDLREAMTSEISILKEKIAGLVQELSEEKGRSAKAEERVDILLRLTQEQSKQLLLTHQNPPGFMQRLFGRLRSKE